LYLANVEPALASVPRVHRFARVPRIADAGTRAAPVAIWIEDADSEAAARTRDALAAGSAAPATVLGGSLKDALASTRCDHVALVRAGDVPALLAVERLGQAAVLAPDAAVITCDDDRLDQARHRVAPRFRPGPSPDRWLACDDSGPLVLVAREPAAALLGELAGGPAWRHELALALAGEAGQAHAHAPLLLCHRGWDAVDPPGLEPGAVARMLTRQGTSARVERSGSVRRVRWTQAHEPRVEAIVCLRDRPELLGRCVESLLAHTDYARLALALVDNGSTDTATLELLRRFQRDPRVRILRDDRPFNFAALNNAAAWSSRADVLVFLNNDTEIVDPDWIAKLVEEALRPEVGAVAPLLLYPNGTIQHAGAAVGLHGYAGHPFAGLRPGTLTPFGSGDGGTRNWLAVTAACLMTERSKFTAVGGFDESFIVAGNDVDLCLRLTRDGYRSLCVPHAVLVHDESRSRGALIDSRDFVRSEQSYGKFRTVGDPFYNPNLTLQRTDCGVRLPGEGVS
jgi:GT2 family glycosyltransferase